MLRGLPTKRAIAAHIVVESISGLGRTQSKRIAETDWIPICIREPVAAATEADRVRVEETHQVRAVVIRPHVQ